MAVLPHDPEQVKIRIDRSRLIISPDATTPPKALSSPPISFVAP